jgi:putative oxidoreductase
MRGSAVHDDIGKLILRVTVGGLVLFHGFAKLGNSGALDWIGRQLADAGLPSVIAYGVFIGEIVGPLMVMAGVYCRVGAVLIIVDMGFALGLAHLAEILTLNEQGGYALELQVLFAFGAAALAFFGSGRYAVKPD